MADVKISELPVASSTDTPDVLPIVQGGVTKQVDVRTLSPSVLTFKTVAVSGQSDVVADSSADTLTLAAGSNMTLTTNAATDTVTFAAASTATDSFKTISVSGQSDVVADSSTDTLTLVAGSNMTITTNAGTDTITFASTGGGGGGTTSQVTGSNFTTATGSLDDITGLSFAASTSKVYEVDALLKVQNTGAGGIKFAITHSASSATGEVLVFAASTSNSSSNTYEAIAVGTAIQTAKCSEANQDFTVWIKAFVTTAPTNAGNITVQMQRLGIGQTATCYIGSRMTVTLLA